MMSQVSPTYSRNLFQEPLAWLYSFWKFSRPHTIVGTTLSVWALYAIALATNHSSISFTNFGEMLEAWLACLCGNVYIVGLNQLEDVAIDKINKPHLPVAAGEFSLQQGWWLVGIGSSMALILAALGGKWLLATVGISLSIGTAYSLPPIRLKRFPFLAAMCIFTVRGVIVNLGLFLHFNLRLSGREFVPDAVWLLTAFILVFTVAIALFKDVPDMEGDKEYNITTFTLLLGKKAIFRVVLWIISACYLGAIAASWVWPIQIDPVFIAAAHLGLLSLLWQRSREVNLENKPEIARFYQLIWKLFFLEYLLFPIACFLASR